MTNLPPIEALAKAAAHLLEDAPDRAYASATNKAAWHLQRGLAVVETHGAFLIPSGTRGGLVHRVSVQHGCSCEAAASGKPCWHHASAVIIEWAREQEKRAARKVTYDEAMAAMAELFA